MDDERIRDLSFRQNAAKFTEINFAATQQTDEYSPTQFIAVVFIQLADLG